MTVRFLNGIWYRYNDDRSKKALKHYSVLLLYLKIYGHMSIVKQWNLEEVDKLDWSWEVWNNEMFVAIKRVMGDHQQQTRKQQEKRFYIKN